MINSQIVAAGQHAGAVEGIIGFITKAEHNLASANELAEILTHLPHKDALRIAKAYKYLDKMKAKFYSAYVVASARTRKPSKLVTEKLKGGGTITYQKVK